MTTQSSDYWGEVDPRNMPRHFFHSSEDHRVHLNFDTAIRANIHKQNFTVCPRFWYIDASMKCRQCRDGFTVSAAEQRTWYEEYGFYVDSFPTRCLNCRQEQRRLKSLRQEYDRDIAAAITSDKHAQKRRLIEVIDGLCEACGDLPAQMLVNRKQLARQVERLGKHPEA